MLCAVLRPPSLPSFSVALPNAATCHLFSRVIHRLQTRKRCRDCCSSALAVTQTRLPSSFCLLSSSFSSSPNNALFSPVCTAQNSFACILQRLPGSSPCFLLAQYNPPSHTSRAISHCINVTPRQPPPSNIANMSSAGVADNDSKLLSALWHRLVLCAF